MKAVICTKYGTPKVFEIKDIEKPIPKLKEVLIKLKATSVTAADIRVRSFTIPFSFWLPAGLILGITKPKKEILGVKSFGIVESIGKGVTQFKEGDEVFAATLQDFGTHAEYICLAEDEPITIKPKALTFKEAAAIPIGARTALHYLKKGNIKKG